MSLSTITILAILASVVSAGYEDYATVSVQVDSSEHGGPEGPVTTTCPCGWANKARTRLVSGNETLPNEFPFMAELMNPQNDSHICGGTIITSRHVLTAAHCTDAYLETNGPISVIVGGHAYEKWEDVENARLIPVSRILQHPGFSIDDSLSLYDISVLVLAEQIRFNKFIGPACVSPVPLNFPTHYLKIIGWGMEWQDGPRSSILRKLKVRAVHMEDCSRAYEMALNYTHPTQICTFGRNRGACIGDSGGPVVYLDIPTNRYFLVGIVSWGVACVSVYPHVHTDVSAYYNWIQEKITESNQIQNMCQKN